MPVNIRQLSLIKENIIDIFEDIDGGRLINNKISKNDIIKLSALLEMYSVRTKEFGSTLYIIESESFDRKYDAIVAEYKYNTRLNKNILESFSNPFKDKNAVSNNNVYMYDNRTLPIDHDKLNINNIRLWDKEVDDKIIYKNGKIVAGKLFGVGDTIETCPIRLISNKDLYSNTIREFAFPIDVKNGIYAVPFGYASYYRNEKTSSSAANADYEYDDSEPKFPCIHIKATSKIPKNCEIVLSSDSMEYGNELTPDHFHYSDKDSVMHSVKNFKFV